MFSFHQRMYVSSSKLSSTCQILLYLYCLYKHSTHVSENHMYTPNMYNYDIAIFKIQEKKLNHIKMAIDWVSIGGDDVRIKNPPIVERNSSHKVRRPWCLNPTVLKLSLRGLLGMWIQRRPHGLCEKDMKTPRCPGGGSSTDKDTKQTGTV